VDHPGFLDIVKRDDARTRSSAGLEGTAAVCITMEDEVRVSERAEVARQAVELLIRDRPELRAHGIELVRALAYPTHLAARFRWQTVDINVEVRADEWWYLAPVELANGAEQQALAERQRIDDERLRIDDARRRTDDGRPRRDDPRPRGDDPRQPPT
jgi:hypothetical protein